jgi:hypothetical protein
MVRAILRGGVIYPLDPVPEGWSDGQELRVQADESTGNGADLDVWSREMAELAAELDDPAAWEQLESCLREADEQAKAWVRREMGLH